MISENVRAGIEILTNIIKSLFVVELPIGITFGEMVVGVIFMPVIFKGLKMLFADFVINETKEEKGAKKK